MSKFANNIFIADVAPKMAGAVDFWFNKTNNIIYYRNPESDTWEPLVGNISQEDLAYLSTIYLTQNAAESTYLNQNEAPTTYVVVNDGFNYGFQGISDSTLPTITLVRGKTYVFDVSNVQPTHPFALRNLSQDTSDVSGTFNNDPMNGKTGESPNTRIVYRVPFNAPSNIFYQCVYHSGMIGTIQIEDEISSGDIVNFATQSELSNYLTTASASSTYLTQTNAASTYLTQTNASSTYLTQTNATSTYLTQANAASTYLTTTYAALTYDTAEQSLTIALSDEVSTITAGVTRASIRAPFAMTLTKIPRASVNTASTSGNPTVDINVAGTSILGANKLSIDANEKTSTTAATPTTLATASIADDAEITFDIDVAGTGAKGLKVTLYYKKA